MTRSAFDCLLFTLRGLSIKLFPKQVPEIPLLFVADLIVMHLFKIPTGVRFVLISELVISAK